MQAPGLLEMYRREWYKAKPDLVIINLGHNDIRGPAFGAALEGFVETNRALGIPTVFIPEPNSSEGPIQSRLQRNHEIMRRVARALDGEPVRGALHPLDGHAGIQPDLDRNALAIDALGRGHWRTRGEIPLADLQRLGFITRQLFRI